ncbi:MAG: 16S rRNA (cytosine(1402)-N(4))-methyltransferase RsmH [Acidimicrobiales bacterium]
MVAMAEGFGERYHTPVLVGEVLQCFAHVPAGWIADVTLGGGGHSEALLESRDDLRVIGIDRDPEAVAAARRRLGRFEDRLRLVHARFSELSNVVKRTLPDTSVEPPTLSGVLADLGVSSHHFDTPERGFSLRSHGELDMRMDQTSQDLTAGEIINTYDESMLVAMLRNSGEARLARRFARAILAARPIRYTDELASIIESATPAPARRGRIHPATRVFQALRLEANQEEAELETLLHAAVQVTGVGGVIAVISYHSGEDSFVKRFFRNLSQVECHCPRELPCVGHPEPIAELLFRGSVSPGAEEIASNVRSRSARMRALRIRRNESKIEPNPTAEGV